ncbi:MAG: S8 family serine peptidase [Saprospiraceae bacterium]
MILLTHHVAFWTALIGLIILYRTATPGAARLGRVAVLLGLGGMVYSFFGMESATATEIFGMAVRDFLLLAAAGGLQLLVSLKKMPFWLSLLLTVIAVGLSSMINKPAAAWTAPAVPTDKFAGLDVPGRLDPAAELLVERRAGVSEADFEQELMDLGLTAERAFFPSRADDTDLDNYYLVDLPAGDQDALTEQLRAAPAVEWLEGNEEVHEIPLLAPTTDVAPARPGNSFVNDPSVTEQWAYDLLGLNEYHALLAELRPVRPARIVILDTGVDAKHEDLTANYVSIQTKYDDDPRGHGTHCAGIAAAVTNNGRGIAGMGGPGNFTQISSIKVLTAGGIGTQATIIRGMLEAVDSGADVLSMSLGGFSSQSTQRAYNQAVKYARDNGAVVVAAAGNSNMDAGGYSPVNAGGVIGVAAIDNLSLRAPFSNRMERIPLSLCAPGVDIYSTLPGNRYFAYSGTSMACPLVAGLVGVLKSLDPSLDTPQIYEILSTTGRELQDGDTVGPLVQPAAAVRRVAAMVE